MNVEEMVKESKEKVFKFLQKRFEESSIQNTIKVSEQFKKQLKVSFSRKINSVLEKFNLHLMKWSDTKTLLALLKIKDAPMIKLAAVHLYFELENGGMKKLQNSYELMADNYSKKIFEWYVKYRVAYAFIGNFAEELYPIPFCGNVSFDEFKRSVRISKEGAYIDSFVIKTSLPEIFSAFITRQYEYFDKVKVESGNVVLDVGALVGNTALYFSKMVGKEGKVYAFEPVQSSFELLKENIVKNNVENVEAVNIGLSDKNFEALMNEAGGGSAVIENVSSDNLQRVKMMRCDDFVEERNLKSVDFIKMDIEGFELKALRGCEETIKRFKPKLAICVYHKGRDMIDIPQYLNKLVPEYEFFLKHNAEKWYDTVLYCAI